MSDPARPCTIGCYGGPGTPKQISDYASCRASITRRMIMTLASDQWSRMSTCFKIARTGEAAILQRKRKTKPRDRWLDPWPEAAPVTQSSYDAVNSALLSPNRLSFALCARGNRGIVASNE